MELTFDCHMTSVAPTIAATDRHDRQPVGAIIAPTVAATFAPCIRPIRLFEEGRHNKNINKKKKNNNKMSSYMESVPDQKKFTYINANQMPLYSVSHCLKLRGFAVQYLKLSDDAATDFRCFGTCRQVLSSSIVRE